MKFSKVLHIQRQLWEPIAEAGRNTAVYKLTGSRRPVVISRGPRYHTTRNRQQVPAEEP